jgi:hypothetical protein
MPTQGARRERPKTALPSSAKHRMQAMNHARSLHSLDVKESLLSDRSQTQSDASSRYTRPRPATAPLSRLSHSAFDSSKGRRVNSALTQVHDGIGVMARQKPELRRYLAQPKVNQRRACRDMSIQPEIEWDRLLAETRGLNSSMEGSADLNHMHQRDEGWYVREVTAIVMQFASSSRRIHSEKEKSMRAMRQLLSEEHTAQSFIGGARRRKMLTQEEKDEAELRRAIINRGGMSAFETPSKVNSFGIPVIDPGTLKLQSDIINTDLHKLENQINHVLTDTGRAKKMKEQAHQAFLVKQKLDFAERANTLVGRLSPAMNADWFWIIPVAALQKAAVGTIQGHRQLLISLRGGQLADANHIMRSQKYDKDAILSPQTLDHLEYDLLVEDFDTSRTIADLWVDFLSACPGATGAHLISRLCAQYMAGMLQEKYAPQSLLQLWKTISASRVYRKVLLRLGATQSIQRIQRSTRISKATAKKRFQHDLNTDNMWKFGFNEGVGVKQKVAYAALKKAEKQKHKLSPTQLAQRAMAAQRREELRSSPAMLVSTYIAGAKKSRGAAERTARRRAGPVKDFVASNITEVRKKRAVKIVQPFRRR